MYRIYCDDNLVYDPNLTGVGFGVVNTKLTQELNKSGSLSFTLPPNNETYNDIQKLKSFVKVFQDDDEIFRGRVLQTTRDFYNKKQVYCEGELAFLYDSIQSPYEFSGSVRDFFKNNIVEHCRQMEYQSEKKWVVGNVTVTDPNDYIVRSDSDYQTTWDVINDKLLKMLGGYLKIRESANVRYIDYLAEYGQKSSQVIEFGKNLLDFSEFIDANELFTTLIPIGKDGLTIADVNNGSIKISDSDAVKLYGTIVKVNKWDDVTVAANLLTKGQEYLKEGIKLATTITVNAVDLHLLDVNTEKIKLGDYIRVVSLAHNIDDYFLCSKIETDLQNPDKTTFTLGITRKGITD